MKAISAIALCAALVFPTAAFAGWGAIAYNASTGRYSEWHGAGSLGLAESGALGACGAGCTIINYEENSCIALATGPGGVWGEGHGYANSNAAIAAALSYCGRGCGWREWACN
jgi:hypothetical protein